MNLQRLATGDHHGAHTGSPPQPAVPTTAPLRALLVLPPMPSRRRSAGVAALCTATPIVIGQALGQPVLGLVASTGALAALYGGRGSARQEALAVGAAALLVSTGMAIGNSLAEHPQFGVAGTALWALVVAIVCALAQSRPPGIVMPVLVCSVGTGLPAGDTWPRTAGVAAVGACAALLSGLVARFPPRGAEATDDVPAGLRDRWSLAATSLPTSPYPWMGFRIAVGVALAGTASLLCHVGRPYWAMATAAAILARGSHAASANTRALLRGTGTFVGCLLAGALASTHPRGIAIAVLLGGLTYVIELVVARNYAIAMIFVTPLSVLLVTSASGTSAVFTTTADRLVETLLGCLAAVAVGQLVSGRWAVRHRRHAIAAVLRATADLLEAGPVSRRTAVLRIASERLRLVGERTAGERRSVRAAVSELDSVAAAALGLAERALRLAAAPDAPRVALALRELAAVVAPCGSGAQARLPSAVPPVLAELGRALDSWPVSSRRPGRLPHRLRHAGAAER